MATSLKVRKQELVRSAIFQAAIDLFVAKGFENTTIEDVAQAAGISRRSFFRYFDGKGDLLAAGDLAYGRVLADAVKVSQQSSVLGIIREAVAAGISHTAAKPFTREILEISEQDASTRRAHHASLLEVEDLLVAAYAQRMKKATKDETIPRLLAGLTMLTVATAVVSWYRGNDKDLVSASKRVLADLEGLLSGSDVLSSVNEASSKKGGIGLQRKTSSSKRPASQSVGRPRK